MSLMSAPQIAALLLIANSAVLVVGMRGSGPMSGNHRPGWLPPRWVRAGIPVIVAAGLFLDQTWAWWVGVVICGSFVLLHAFAGPVLAHGGFFRGTGAGYRLLHFALSLATMLGAFILLLSAKA